MTREDHEATSGGARDVLGSLVDAFPTYPPPDVPAPLAVWEYTDALRSLVRRYQRALLRCVIASGADVSGGIPAYPDLDEWAVQEVEQLRLDYDGALDDSRADGVGAS